jgi:uncharacterized protein
VASNSLLRLNVGFLVNLPVGESRDFHFDIPRIHLKPDLLLSNLLGWAHITRTAQGLLTHVAMEAFTQSECVRCLSEFDLHLQIDFTELYAFSKASLGEGGMLLPDDMHIDFSSIVREYMLLDIPISPVCKPDCKGLCPICGENQNETTCHHQDEDVDPRLSALRSLLDQT